MFVARRIYLSSIILVTISLVASPSSNAGSQNVTAFALVPGNPRVGAGVERARMSLEQSSGGGYRVAAADEQRGYVQGSLRELAANTTPQPAPGKISAPEAQESSKSTVPAAVPAAGTVSPTQKPSKPAAVSAPAGREEQPQDPEAKSQSILQLIEGHESEVKYGLMIAVAAFVLGWICGGGFYARRERRSRYKLRF